MPQNSRLPSLLIGTIKYSHGARQGLPALASRNTAPCRCRCEDLLRFWPYSRRQAPQAWRAWRRWGAWRRLTEQPAERSLRSATRTSCDAMIRGAYDLHTGKELAHGPLLSAHWKIIRTRVLIFCPIVCPLAQRLIISAHGWRTGPGIALEASVRSHLLARACARTCACESTHARPRQTDSGTFAPTDISTLLSCICCGAEPWQAAIAVTDRHRSDTLRPRLAGLTWLSAASFAAVRSWISR